MDKIKQFFAKKTVGYYLFLGAALMALLAVIVYSARGGDVLTKLSVAVIILFVAGLVINIAMAIKDIKPLEIVPFVLYLAALFVFIDSEIDFLGNVFMGIDGNTLDGALIFAVVAGVLAVGLGMASAIMKHEKE